MDASAQSMKGGFERKMDEVRGEIQCMGLNLQAGIRGIMAAPRGGATEPTRGSVECVQPAMETGEVGITRDATTIIGETCRVRHEGTTEKLKEVTETQEIKETKSQEFTEIINEVTETQKSKEGNELDKLNDEHTHI